LAFSSAALTVLAISKSPFSDANSAME
jgi:hypothetical protein